MDISNIHDIEHIYSTEEINNFVCNLPDGAVTQAWSWINTRLDEKGNFLNLASNLKYFFLSLIIHKLSLTLAEYKDLAFFEPSEVLRRLFQNSYLDLGEKPQQNMKLLEGLPSLLLVGAFEPGELPIGRFNAPPFGLVRLASFLRSFGIRTEVYDVTTHGPDILLKWVSEEKFDFIGFSVLATTLPLDIQLMYEVKKHTPDSMIIAGGQAATFRPDLIHQSPADFLCLGYGEYPILDYFFNISFSKSNPLNVAGFSHRTIDGFGLIRAAKPIDEMDIKIFSYTYSPKLIDASNYWQFNYQYSAEENSIKAARIYSQTFCPHSCIFCSSRNFLKFCTNSNRMLGKLYEFDGSYFQNTNSQYTQTFTELSAKDLFDLVKKVIFEYQPDLQTIFINDDNFFVNFKRFKEFADLVSSSQKLTNTQFICSARVDDISDEILPLAHSCGVSQINFGVESFSNTTLLTLNKGVSSPNNSSPADVCKKAINRCLDNDIIPGINLIMFAPEVEIQSIIENIDVSLDFLEQRVEMNIASFVLPYFGADILANNYPVEKVIEYVGVDSFQKIIVPTKILPIHKLIRQLSYDVLIDRAIAEEKTKQSYGWNRKRAPKEVVHLVFFMSIIKRAQDLGLIDKASARQRLDHIKLLINKKFELESFIRKESAGITNFIKGSIIETFIEDQHIALNSISIEHSESILKKLQKLEKDNLLDEHAALVTKLISLNTELFSEYWDKYSYMKEYLQMLFLCKGKTRLWHLNKYERYFVFVLFLISEEVSISDETSKIFNTFDLYLDSARNTLNPLITHLLSEGEVEYWEHPELQPGSIRNIQALHQVSDFIQR
ncbi:MAG: B12-binding domain-containing radical SAM protein [Thermoleophilia bacterium]